MDMTPLSPDLRNLLARTVQAARRDAEAGARRALEALAVDRRVPHPGTAPDEQALRRRLRAHGRQLGDRRDARATQRIDRLAHEVACEHWHRMLFARFLAENGLLIEPDSGVPVSLAECAELAREQGADPWALAGRFAARMLPRIFRADDPALAVTLAPETRQALERRVESLPRAVFTAGDALGWTYQFWQAERKEEVNRAGAKIGADELPAVTQLFTEPYMVGFLLHNTLGAWRAGRLLAERPDLAETAPDEAALRRAVRLEAAGGYDFAWLRFVREAPGDAAHGGDQPGDEASNDAPGGDAPASHPPGADRPGDETARDASGADPRRGPSGGEASRDALGDETSRREALGGDAPERLAGPWRPAAGAFAAWPRRAAELRVLDPCCGSGHFLVEAFALLVLLRMDEERLAVDDAIRAVLRDNLFGLEIDPRCTQIAAFNLALAAWRLAGRPIDLPPLNVACSGLAPHAPLDEWVALAEEAAAAGGMPAERDLLGVDDSLLSAPLRTSLTALHELFGQAPELGSLLDPSALGADLFQADFEATRETLRAALDRERGSDETAERSVAAQGMARAAELLAERYTLVVTNVPYLARGRQSDVLKAFAARRHPEAKADLATLFVSRIFDWLAPHGAQAVVTPQNWLFLTSYRKLRERLLRERTWNLVARLGPGAFETIGGHVVNVALNVLSAERPAPDWRMAGIDVSAPRGRRPIRAAEKAALLRGDAVAGAAPEPTPETAVGRTAGDGWADDADRRVAPARTAREPGEEERSASGEESDNREDGFREKRLVASEPELSFVWQRQQIAQLSNPDSRIVLNSETTDVLLEEFAHGVHGLGSKDTPCFFRQYWEVPDDQVGSQKPWEFLQTTVISSRMFGGMEQAVYWENGRGILAERGKRGEAVLAGRMAWNRPGVLISQIGGLPACMYLGDIFDKNSAVISPRKTEHLPAIWCFCSSSQFSASVREIDQKLNVTNATLVKVPFDLDHWQQVAAEKYPNGLPEPHTDDPTQWIFHGHPCGSVVWDDEAKRTAHGPPRTDAAVLQVAVARLVGYRWPAERDPKMRLAAEMRAWVERCRPLDEFADPDGIVCLPAVAGEPAAADRLRRLLAAAYGPDWSAAVERRLLAAAAGGARPADSLEAWLRDRFFAEHCRRFHHRPFVWHVWDGRRDGFSALVNYHRLAAPGGAGRRTLEALAYSCVGDWIARQEADQRDGKEGADGRLAAALDLRRQLERILEGEPPCDLFVRWKPLAEQPVGWTPDGNDGVRLNLRPFLSAELARGGRAGAGVLRWKPNVAWGKDRGKEPAALRPRDEFPWFWSGPGGGTVDERTDFTGGEEFDGNRWNDMHYTNAVKRAAREAVRPEPGRRGRAGSDAV